MEKPIKTEETNKPDWPELHEKYGLGWSVVANDVREIGVEKTLEKFANAIKARSDVKNYIENIASIVLQPSIDEIIAREKKFRSGGLNA